MTRRVASAARPSLPPHVVLRFDTVRDRWVILAPERVLMPNQTALDVLRRCDGKTPVSAIADSLAEAYSAPRENVLGDVTELLQNLADKGFVTP